MFERYTEKARRVIFFARYKASQYGSPIIAPEHLLLGLLREDRATMHRLVGRTDLTTEIRTEIDKAIHRGKPFATSVEVPLSAESKKTLNFAGEEADRSGLRHVGTEHILLAILRLEKSLAATLLIAKGAKPDEIRQ
jgi:ATP-dependent Clp protease ATP-binding subunit ClpC